MGLAVQKEDDRIKAPAEKLRNFLFVGTRIFWKAFNAGKGVN
jgi:hypothetical protein